MEQEELLPSSVSAQSFTPVGTQTNGVSLLNVTDGLGKTGTHVRIQANVSEIPYKVLIRQNFGSSQNCSPFFFKKKIWIHLRLAGEALTVK